MINHISAKSPYFLDFLEKKDESAYADLFIRYKNFWPNGELTQEDVDLIYKRKPRALYCIAKFADCSEEKVWCTFDEQQIDLDVTTETTRRFIQQNLEQLADHGASIIRLDAFAYAYWHQKERKFFQKFMNITPFSKKSLSKTTMSMTLPFRCWFFMLYIQVMSTVLFTGWKSALTSNLQPCTRSGRCQGLADR